MSFTLEMSHSGMVEPGGEKETMPKSMPKGGGSRPKRSASTEGCNSMAELLPNRFDFQAIYRRKKSQKNTLESAPHFIQLTNSWQANVPLAL